MPGVKSMPKTIQRSPKKAQETYEKVLENAEEEYGEGERAHRTAFAALKNSYEKVGDRWVAKDEKGPSDPRSALPRGSAAKRRGRRRVGAWATAARPRSTSTSFARARPIRRGPPPPGSGTPRRSRLSGPSST